MSSTDRPQRGGSSKRKEWLEEVVQVSSRQKKKSNTSSTVEPSEPIIKIGQKKKKLTGTVPENSQFSIKGCGCREMSALSKFSLHVF